MKIAILDSGPAPVFRPSLDVEGARCRALLPSPVAA
jgi:hypothetical protein